MTAQQQERENQNCDDQGTKHSRRQSPRTLEETRFPCGWFLQSVSQAGDAHLIDCIDLARVSGVGSQVGNQHGS
jgi:hypothetical protein